MNLPQRTLIAVTLLATSVWVAVLIIAATFRAATPGAMDHAFQASSGEPATRPSVWPVPIAPDPGLPTPEQVHARLAAVKGNVDEK